MINVNVFIAARRSEQHLNGLEIVVRGFVRNLWNQRIAETHDRALLDVAQVRAGAFTQEGEKLIDPFLIQLVTACLALELFFALASQQRSPPRWHEASF